MSRKLQVKMKESMSSVLPITAIVILLHFTIAPLPIGTLFLFLSGMILLIFGMGFFTLGAEIAMMPMGEQLGAYLTKSRKIGLLIFVCFFIGVIITIAEPDLQVLANQVPAVPNATLIISVSIGVGIFLVIALLRTLFQIRLSFVLIFFYLIVFTIATFIPKDYLAVAFDSGGVTTGPITVPFILALGVGLSSVRGGNSSHDDSFGLVALCSIGPILMVMIIGLFFDSSSSSYAAVIVSEVHTPDALLSLFGNGFPKYAKEVGMALLPIILFFLVFQFVALKLPRRQMLKLGVGMLYTYTGLVLFLTGVNVGFMPAGNYIGKEIASLPYYFILIPLGMVIGFFIVAAEPAVHVLNVQVEEISGGAISKKAMLLSLSLGVAISIGIAMVRVTTGISIWYFLIVGYVIALVLTFFVPKIFSAIAFDSGGVASGPMTATFLLPFAMGACEALGGNMMMDAFGIVAMVAMTPLITIQILGLFYTIKMKRSDKELLETANEAAVEENQDNDIIEF